MNISQYSWWQSPISKRVFVVTAKWSSGSGPDYKVDQIDLLEKGSEKPKTRPLEEVEDLIAKGELVPCTPDPA